MPKDSGNSSLGSELVKAIPAKAVAWAFIAFCISISGLLVFAIVGGFAGFGTYFLGYEFGVTSSRGDPSASPSLPAGMIVASQIPCNELVGSPATFRDGSGRFLVGAGTFRGPDEETFVFEPPSPTEFMYGGQIAFPLNSDNVPDHTHTYADGYHLQAAVGAPTLDGFRTRDFVEGIGVSGGDTGNSLWEFDRQTEYNVTTGEQIEYLPPYVAVNFCVY